MIRRSAIGSSICALLFLVAGSGAGSAQVLTSGELLIRGAVLEISPVSQEIDPGRSTVVHTEIAGLSVAEMPSGLRVEGTLN